MTTPEEAADAREQLVLRGIIEQLVATDGEPMTVPGNSLNLPLVDAACRHLTQMQVDSIADAVRSMGWHVESIARSALTARDGNTLYEARFEVSGIGRWPERVGPAPHVVVDRAMLTGRGRRLLEIQAGVMHFSPAGLRVVADELGIRGPHPVDGAVFRARVAGAVENSLADVRGEARRFTEEEIASAARAQGTPYQEPGAMDIMTATDETLDRLGATIGMARLWDGGDDHDSRPAEPESDQDYRARIWPEAARRARARRRHAALETDGRIRAGGCERCNGTGVWETGNNDVPCPCPLGRQHDNASWWTRR